MIIVEGWVRMRSAMEIDRLRDAAVEMMHATKLEEGCLDYAYALDLAEPDLLRVIERWTDEAALAAHFASSHMATFNQALAGAKIAAASVKAYAGEEVRTLVAL